VTLTLAWEMETATRIWMSLVSPWSWKVLPRRFLTSSSRSGIGYCPTVFLAQACFTKLTYIIGQQDPQYFVYSRLKVDDLLPFRNLVNDHYVGQVLRTKQVVQEDFESEWKLSPSCIEYVDYSTSQPFWSSILGVRLNTLFPPFHCSSPP